MGSTTMLLSSSYTIYSSPVLIPLLPVIGSIQISLLEVQQKKGQPTRFLSSISCLALGIAWPRTRGSYMILQIIFGLTHGSLSVWLRFSRRMIVKVLLTNEDAIVRLPTADEDTLFATMINQKNPIIKIVGEMDGLKMTLQRACV